MKITLFLIIFLLHSFFIFAQQGKKQIGVFANVSFPLTNQYETGYGGGISYEIPNLKAKTAFTLDASFTHFNSKFASFASYLNMNYIAINPGYKVFLNNHQFYFYGGGGGVLELPATSKVRIGGLLLNAGVGYQIKAGKGSVDFSPRINVIAGNTYVKYWVSAGLRYAFELSSKTK